MLKSELEWDIVVRRAGEEAVAPLLYHCLKDYSERLPASTLEILKKLCPQHGTQSLYV